VGSCVRHVCDVFGFVCHFNVGEFLVSSIVFDNTNFSISCHKNRKLGFISVNTGLPVPETLRQVLISLMSALSRSSKDTERV